MARILTLLATAIKASHAAPGYTYKGTMIFTGSELTGVMAHKSPEGEVGVTVGLVVGAAVGGAVVGFGVGAGVLGAGVLGVVVGLVVGATVGGAVVGLGVGAGVLGAVVGLLAAAVGAVVAAAPVYLASVSTVWSGTMLATWTEIVAPEVEVRRKVKGAVKVRPPGAEMV
jgi:hypothetical protein